MNERNDQVEPAFYRTAYACRYLGISPTMLKECRQAGLIEFVVIGEDNVRFTKDELERFKDYIKAGGLRGIHKEFLRLGIRRPRKRQKKKPSRLLRTGQETAV
jgi:hypothetical protein